MNEFELTFEILANLHARLKIIEAYLKDKDALDTNIDAESCSALLIRLDKILPRVRPKR